MVKILLSILILLIGVFCSNVPEKTTVDLAFLKFIASIPGDSKPQTTAYSNNYVYVANTTGNSISGFFQDSTTGSLSNLIGSPFTGVTDPSWIVRHPTYNILYVAGKSSNLIYVFNIQPDTGTLTFNRSITPNRTIPASMHIDPNTSILYVLHNLPLSYITYYTLDQTGGVAYLGEFLLNTGAGTEQPDVMIPHPVRKNQVYINISGNSTIRGYTLGAGGAITNINNIASCATPRNITILPDGNFLYAGCNPAAGAGLSLYSINSTTGALTAVADYSLTTNQKPIALTASQNFLYTSGTNYTNTYIHSITAGTGVPALTESFSPVVGVIMVSYITIDPTGKFFYVSSGTAAGELRSYSISANGDIVPTTSASTYTVGGTPKHIYFTQISGVK